MRTMKVSERFACRVTGQNRSTQRRPPATTTPADPDAGLRAWLRAWAKDRGFRPAYHDARAEGWNVNHKKIQRLWRDEGLRVPQRRRRKRLGASTTPNPPTADAPNVVWAVDFQFDATTDGRPIKIVSIVDEHTRECLGGLVERNITGRHLIDELDRLAVDRGYPAVLLRQRLRFRLRRDGRLGRRTRRPALHPTRPALAQRQHRVVQQPGARRMPQHQHFLVTGSGAGGDQRLEGGLQPPLHRVAAWATCSRQTFKPRL
jgi:hypothetical protein